MSTNGSTNGHSADIDIDSLYSFWPGTTPAPQPCPEAAFSITLRGTLGGIETLLTARGQTAAEFKANLEAIRGLLDAPQAASQEGAPIKDFCPVHQVRMQRHENAGGVWYSHFTEGRHCKGKGVAHG